MPAFFDMLARKFAEAGVQVNRRAFDLAGRCIEQRTTLGDAFAFQYTAQVR